MDLLRLILYRLMRYVNSVLEAHARSITLIEGVHHGLIDIKDQQELAAVVDVPVWQQDARHLLVVLIILG